MGLSFDVLNNAVFEMHFKYEIIPKTIICLKLFVSEPIINFTFKLEETKLKIV